MSRPRLPSNILELRGGFVKNPSRRREREAQEAARPSLPALAKLPAAPDWLPNAYAREDWRVRGARLVRLGRLSEANLVLFAHLCALSGVVKQGWSSGGAPKNALLRMLRRLEADFGLSAMRRPET